MEELHERMRGLVRAADRLDLEDLEAYRDTLRRADSVGPILDPTAWRRSKSTRDEHATLVDAAIAFKRAVDETRERSLAEIVKLGQAAERNCQCQGRGYGKCNWCIAVGL